MRGRAVLTAAGAALFVAALGASVTDLGPWYQDLVKPSWQPPGPVFGIAWTIIYALTAAAGVLTWRAARGAAREWTVGLFALNGALNVFWSLLFFRARRPDWALIEVGFLWLSILALIVFAWRQDKRAALLLAPYLIWVTIAAAMNYEIVRLNAPFGAT